MVVRRIVLISTLALAALFGLIELEDFDLPFHRTMGQYLVEHGAFPPHNPFLYTAGDFPYFTDKWLYQVLSHLLLTYAGPLAFVALRMAILALVAWFLMAASGGKGTKMVPAAFTVLALHVASERFQWRAELFDYVFLSFFVWWLERWRLGVPTRPWAPAIVLVLWSNLHGYFIQALILMAIYLVANLARAWRHRRLSGIVAPRWRLLLGILLWGGVAAFLNPYFVQGAFYPLRTIYDLAKDSSFQFYLESIAEFSPPLAHGFFDSHAITSYKWLLALVAAGIVLRLGRLPLEHLLALAAFTAMSLSMKRNLSYFAIVAAPLMAQAWEKIFLSWEERWKLPARLKQGLSLGAALALLLALGISADGLATNRFYLSDRSRRRAGWDYSSIAYPSRGAAFILGENVQGPFFNNFDNGSFLIERLYPKHQLFINGDCGLSYGFDFFAEYSHLTAPQTPLEVILDRYPINAFILNHTAEDSPPLIEKLRRHPNWHLIFAGPVEVIFLREAPQNRDLIQRFRLDDQPLPRPTPEPKRPFPWFRREEPSPFLLAAHARLLEMLGRLEDAAGAYRDAIAINSRFGEIHESLGRVLLKRGERQAAAEAFEKARNLLPEYPPPSLQLALLAEDLHGAEAAVDKLKAHVARFDRAAAGWMHLGRILAIKLQRPAEAEAALRRAVELAPRHGEAHRLLAVALQAVGKKEEALPYAERAAELEPRDFRAHYLAGWLFGQLPERGEKGRKHLQIALRLIEESPQRDQGERAALRQEIRRLLEND